MASGFVPMGGQSHFQAPPRSGPVGYCSAALPEHDQSHSLGSPIHQQSSFESGVSCGGSPQVTSGYGGVSRPLKIAELEQGVPAVVWARTLPSPQSQASQQLIEQLRTATAHTEAMRQDTVRLVSELQAPAAAPCVAHQLRPPRAQRLEPPRPSSSTWSSQASAVTPEQPQPYAAARASSSTWSSQASAATPEQPQANAPEGGNFVLPRRQHGLNEVNLPQWSNSSSYNSPSGPSSSEHPDGRLQQPQGSSSGSNYSTLVAIEPQQPDQEAKPSVFSSVESIFSTILPSQSQALDEHTQLPQKSTSSSIFATILPSQWQQDESVHASQTSPSQCKRPDAEEWWPGVMTSWRPQQKPPEQPVAAFDSRNFSQSPAGSMSSYQLPEVQRCLLVSLGILEFDSFGALGTPGLFETSGFRILLQTGARAPMVWTEGLPATERKELKYNREVSSDGRYSGRLSCDFSEVVKVHVPSEGPPPELLCVDVWYERRTVVEQFDSILNFVGLGNGMPEFEKVFLGRISAGVPPEDGESLAQSYPVQVGKSCEGPRPKAMTLSLEWATQPTQQPH